MKRLKPLRPEPVVTPQCCMPFDPKPYSGEYIKRRTERCDKLGWSINQCGKPSTYEIEDHKYCTQHAGQKALAILMAEARAHEDDAS